MLHVHQVTPVCLPPGPLAIPHHIHNIDNKKQRNSHRSLMLAHSNSETVKKKSLLPMFHRHHTLP